MKRSQNSFYSVSALAFFALLGLAGCPQEAKEEGKSAPADPPAVAAPAITPAAAPTAPAAPTDPTAQPAPAAAGPTAAPAAGEALKPDPGKVVAGDAKPASAN